MSALLEIRLAEQAINYNEAASTIALMAGLLIAFVSHLAFRSLAGILVGAVLVTGSLYPANNISQNAARIDQLCPQAFDELQARFDKADLAMVAKRCDLPSLVAEAVITGKISREKAAALLVERRGR